LLSLLLIKIQYQDINKDIEINTIMVKFFLLNLILNPNLDLKFY
jgi:hypothetical protein